MNHAGGSFIGYREYLPTGMSRRIHAGLPTVRPAMRLHWFDWDNLGRFGYDYQVLTGTAEDEFPAEFIRFRFQSRLVCAQVWGNPADFQLTYDGTNPLPVRVFEYGFIRVESAVGFRVRNFVPGLPSRYSILALT